MMQHNHGKIDLHNIIHEIKHYLPAQAPLKDFIHHNTLHAFQKHQFFDGIRHASQIFGYKVSLSLREYRDLYLKNKIQDEIIDKIIEEQKGKNNIAEWRNKLIKTAVEEEREARIGDLRNYWKAHYKFDLDAKVFPILFRVLCSFLDQGISLWSFPTGNIPFLDALREIERNSYISIFKTQKAKEILLENKWTLEDLLKRIVGKESFYEQYLFDQQFSHQGWSGMVSTIEDQPETMLNKKIIRLEDLIYFELLLEIDIMNAKYGDQWEPLCNVVKEEQFDLLAPVKISEQDEVLKLWQLAYEWSYYDVVLKGIELLKEEHSKPIINKSFQGVFCIDDRECSLRRYLENIDPQCETFGTPGFFGVEFYFKPLGGNFITKVCPAPVTPKYLIKELDGTPKIGNEAHFGSHAHGLFQGLFISPTLGLWSAIKLFFNIIRPTMSPATASSFKHMDPHSNLTIENRDVHDIEDGLQLGFNIDEMVIRTENMLKSIGLVKDFADIVYIVGHGSSSVNNPHFAAYDCGACSGRAGSVNARTISYMANHPKVRIALKSKGIDIPDNTQFIGALHDTTRDDISFFDENSLNENNAKNHIQNKLCFEQAMDLNARERSRRFESIDTSKTPHQIHEAIKTRSVSIFEPRPELNHATNTLCIVGRRDMTKKLFLDRRSFMNSYDYTIDLDGKYLLSILNAAAPVCGGINLEYFFSRVDNQKLGAGTKLPHNVMGLFGVANGIDGDLRPGLPSQMIEVHDPMRLMIVVEHFPNTVLDVIKRNPATYEWFINEWINLVVVNPESKALFRFVNGAFVQYQPSCEKLHVVHDITPLLISSQENIPVCIIN